MDDMDPRAIPDVPVSFHRSEDELPFVPFADHVTFQLLHVNVAAELWVVRVRFEPGVTIQRHRHTGEVFAVTFSGSWKYLEYPEVNSAGSYLYEPAGAVHTLHVLDDNTEITDVWFAVRGANHDLDDDGNVENILDAATILQIYRERCAEAGLPDPDIIGA